MLRVLYLLVIVIGLLPTLPGLLGVMAAALGYIPALDLHHVGLNGFTEVWQWHGVWHSIGLSVFSTLVSSALACLLTFMILQASWGKRAWRRVEITLSPLLAMPHVAFAIGFAFLFAPTGMGARVLSALFGYDPNAQSVDHLALVVNDPYAVGLTLMLTLKEVPFLLLMSIAILQQIDVAKRLKVSASLGYSPAHTWWKVIFPQWLTKLRFPLLAVVAYSVSVVDVALILGPTNPPTFAVLVWQWFNDPDLSLLPRAASGAVVLFVLAALMIALMRGLEWLITKRLRQWQYSGRYGAAWPGNLMFNLLLTLFCVLLPLLIIWTVAQRWRFPDLLPSRYSSRFWQYEWQSILDALSQSLLLALVSATVALVLALLAHEYRIRARWFAPNALIAIPMLLPQLSILFGLQIVTLVISSDAYWLWVCWAHVFFAFPYIYLSLDGPWRSFESGLMRIALSLGKTPWHAWRSIKLPILLPAVVFAWAVGVSVSLAQYLPTLMLGAGRITTITTEAVAISSGYDRRVTAIYALWQALLPLLFFFMAMLVSRWQAKHRRLSIKGLMPNESLSRKPHHS